MTAAWLAILVFPVLVALMFAADEPTRRIARSLAPWTALPALIVAFTWPVGRMHVVSWFMLSARVGLDEPGQIFMLLTAVLWTISGVYARYYHATDSARDRFWVCFLLTMTGNLGLIMSHDLPSFYLFFALMTFSAFGLVVHDGTELAHFAARVYIIMAVAAEAMLLTALLLIALSAGRLDTTVPAQAVLQSLAPNLTIALLLLGFGVKAGAVLLHMWLPLAHPAAPTAASAVLSGAMIKAGLLGWLRFLPGGEADLLNWGELVIILGLVGSFFGIIIGLPQRNPKVILAYSSISQMGYMTVGLGIGLCDAHAWPAAVLGVSLYALHHAMAKGSLFLGVGIWQRAARKKIEHRAVVFGMALAALALAGAPLTSGFLAKAALLYVPIEFPRLWMQWIDVAMSIAAIGTTLLMGRLLWIIFTEMPAKHHQPEQRLWHPWWVSIVMVLTLSWFAPAWFHIEAMPPGLFAWNKIWVSLWPVVIGVTITALAAWLAWRPIQRFEIPPGDLLFLFNRFYGGVRRSWAQVVVPTSEHLSARFYHARNRALLRLGRWMFERELRLVRWGSAGLMVLGLMLVMLFILILERAGVLR